jgi:hypothetical protein
MFPELEEKTDLSNIKFSSNTEEWYTPGGVAMAARMVMNGIALDPASSAQANETVKAQRYYTRDDDGLRKSWKARSVWLNPPYGKYRGESNQGRWSKRLVYEYQQGNVGQAILLVNAYVGYKWWTKLVKLSSIAHGLCDESVLSPNFNGCAPVPPMCLSFDLLRFEQPDNGENNGSTAGKAKYGSAIFYYGENAEAFKLVFSRFGFVVGV